MCYAKTYVGGDHDILVYESLVVCNEFGGHDIY